MHSNTFTDFPLIYIFISFQYLILSEGYKLQENSLIKFRDFVSHDTLKLHFAFG